MAGSKKKPTFLTISLDEWLNEKAKVRALTDRIAELEAALKFNSARYSEGGSGDYINNSRFEPAKETDNAT